MTAKLRIPGDLEVPTRFFGRFTWKDLLRIGLPVLVAVGYIYQGSASSTRTLLLLAAGGVVGLTWYLIQPYQQHLDTHIYHGARWLMQKKTGETRRLEEQGEDYVLVETGAAIGIIEVSPTNLEMKTEAEQRAIHAVYRSLFDTVTYPVQIHSRQKPFDLTEYVNHIQEQVPHRELLKKDYFNYCHSLVDDDLSRTHHYIILRVDRDSRTWLENKLRNKLPLEHDSSETGIQTAINELDSRCREVVQALDSSEITAERVTGQQLHQITEEFDLIQDADYTPRWTAKPFNDSFGEYRRSLYISEFPSQLSLGWTLQLLRTQGLIDITQTVKPENSADASKKLQRLSEKLNAEIDSLLQQGYRGTNKLEGLLDDVEWFLNLLADKEDSPVEYGVYITAHHSDREKCLRTFKQVCNRLDTLQIDYREPVLRTDQALSAYNPLHSDQLDETLFMPAGSAAVGFPFATQDTDQDSGVIFGVDKSDETPVLLDRFQWSSHSMARMGMVGSGKSYAAKIELLRASLNYSNLKIIVVDPKQEYSRVVRNLGGQTQKLQQDTEYSLDQDVTGFTVEERGQQDNVDLLTEAVEQIYREASQNTEKTLVVIDEARILLNSETGRRVLNQFVLESRDTNTAVTLITQNASHFTHSREGREILDNMPGKVFMRHDRVPDSVVDYFELSQREKQELFELKTGTDSEYSEALLRVSGKIKTRLRIESTPQEHAVIEAGEGKP